MNTLLSLALTLILPSVALAATSTKMDLKVAACRKVCIPIHDAKVLACKTIQSKEGDDCVAHADQERRDCETACENERTRKTRKKAAAPVSTNRP